MNKKATVFIIHTSRVSVDHTNDLFKELAPEVVVRNIVDDSLLPEVLANGGVTPGVTRRICAYAVEAESAGADLIFNQCSSVGEAADVAARLVRVPLVKVDEKMAEAACQTGRKVGVVATLPTTLGPTVRLIQKTAVRLGKQVEVTQKLCEGAFDRLIAGDTKTHNSMVISAIRELARDVDVIACAQGSMVALLPELGKTAVPVLTSPRLGVERALEILRKT
jgi:aspartate/glutamate racemase